MQPNCHEPCCHEVSDLSKSKDDANSLEDLSKLYSSLRPAIEQRLHEFGEVWREKDDKRLFEELAFCLLTPQSRARSCWSAIESLSSKGLVEGGSPEEIWPLLRGVRFKYRKSEYICLARESQSEELTRRLSSFEGDAAAAREYLVKEVKGMGYKEASHFLRNIGWGLNLAILDRHIMKNLYRFGVIDEIPSSLSKKKYLQIEEAMRQFSNKISIPMDHLDLLLWYMEAGEIFK